MSGGRKCLPMRKISDKVNRVWESDPFNKMCVYRYRTDATPCAGRITREHALIYAGKQMDEPYAIIPVCAKHHGVDEYQGRGVEDKRYHEFVAITRGLPDIERYGRRDWRTELSRLRLRYNGVLKSFPQQ